MNLYRIAASSFSSFTGLTRCAKKPATFLAFLVCSVFALAAVGVRAGSNGSTEGTFVGIEQGDYAHFLIKDKKGKDDSFIVLRPDKSVQPYLDNPDKLKGKRIRVHWEEQTIPEAGGKMKTVMKVEARKG